jgi:hypothetical protein
VSCFKVNLQVYENNKHALSNADNVNKLTVQYKKVVSAMLHAMKTCAGVEIKLHADQDNDSLPLSLKTVIGSYPDPVESIPHLHTFRFFRKTCIMYLL